MKLWLVENGGRGISIDIDVVRAETAEEAAGMCGLGRYRNTIVTELVVEGEPGIVWGYDYCPDSPRE